MGSSIRPRESHLCRFPRLQGSFCFFCGQLIQEGGDVANRRQETMENGDRQVKSRRIWSVVSASIGSRARCMATIAPSVAGWSLVMPKGGRRPTSQGRNDTRRWMLMTKVVERYDMMVIERRGTSGWDAQSFRTYLVLGHFWIHINKHLRWPLVSFKWLPFWEFIY